MRALHLHKNKQDSIRSTLSGVTIILQVEAIPGDTTVLEVLRSQKEKTKTVILNEAVKLRPVSRETVFTSIVAGK